MLFTIQIEADSLGEALAKLQSAETATPPVAPPNNITPFPSSAAVAPAIPVAPVAPQPQTVYQPPIPSPAQTGYAPPTPPSYNTSAAPVAPPPTYAPPSAFAPPTVPTQAPTYTQEDLMRAATPLLDIGKGPQLQQILANMGVPHLGQLPAERYGEFALELQKLGAKL